MNTVLKYVIGLDLLNCHAKFRGDTISRSREIFSSFPDIPERKLSLSSWVMEGGCNVARLYVLQSYRSCIFVSVKLEARRSFG